VTHNIEEAVFLGKKILVLSQLPNKSVIQVDNLIRVLKVSEIQTLLMKYAINSGN